MLNAKNFFRLFVAMFACLLAAGMGTDIMANQENTPSDGHRTPPAMQKKLVSPEKALFSPNMAQLDVQQKARLYRFGEHEQLTFFLPANAANLRLAVENHTILRWSTRIVELESQSLVSDAREKLSDDLIRLQGELLAVKARIALWQGIPQNITGQEMAGRQQQMAESLPGLSSHKDQLEEKIRIVQMEIAGLHDNPHVGQQVDVILQDKAVPDSEVTVHYNYTLPDCGWQPVYDFNAKPDEGSGDMVDVRLLAEIWQYSGMDWKNTAITLATRGGGPREPAPLPEWVVESTPKPQRPQPRDMPVALNAARAINDEAVTATGMKAARNAPVDADTRAVYASWKLETPGLPEGRYRLGITADAWKAPLQWLARPSRDDSRVWMFAKYDLPANQAWPAGQAQYSVNGQNVGAGFFTPRGGEATLYFGADPRVNVITTIDGKKRGESGFIQTSKTWTWAWTYTISNQHNKPIKVRLERPAPMIVDEGVTVSYNDKPEAKENAKEHYLYWEVKVPADGKAEVEHSVTISSPNKLPLLPDIP